MNLIPMARWLPVVKDIVDWLNIVKEAPSRWQGTAVGGTRRQLNLDGDPLDTGEWRDNGLYSTGTAADGTRGRQEGK
jgi:hypothetical protein